MTDFSPLKQCSGALLLGVLAAASLTLTALAQPLPEPPAAASPSPGSPQTQPNPPEGETESATPPVPSEAMPPPGGSASPAPQTQPSPPEGETESATPPAPSETKPPRVTAPVVPLHRVPRRARAAWVAAANPLAVEAGIEILAKGGKALDAAVAVQAMLGLVEPQSSGVGGGGFLLYYDAGSGRVSAIDGRETAPAGARPDMFLDEHGRPLPLVEAVRSGRSTGVPGVIAMLHTAHAKVGALPWKELFEPAIRAATSGFRVSARLSMFLGEGSPFPPTTEIRSLFSRADGETVQEGDLFANPEYARTLQRIASEGPRALYQGAIAQGIVNTTHQEPFAGTMTLKDLAGYRSSWTQPVCRPYQGFTVCVPPPPSSGVSLLQMLEILEQTDIAKRGPADPQAWFLFAQASRLMYADRDRYIADPKFVHVPVERLLDPKYIKLRAQLIGVRAGPTPPPGDIPVSRGRDATNEAAGTSHFVIVDADGDVVSMTTTVESVFGSGRAVSGFVLNNQLTDFSFVPSEGGALVANAVRGGKRPRSSMAPVVVLDHAGNFIAALGSPGGSAILEYNAKTLVGILAWRLSMKQAIELPNLIARGDSFGGELSRFSPALIAGLRERGIDLQSGRAENSGLHGVLRHADGTYEGAADSRREGVARVLAAPQAGRRAAAH